jgi:hypothetical protein
MDQCHIIVYIAFLIEISDITVIIYRHDSTNVIIKTDRIKYQKWELS